jgi:hypothetical protein
VVGFHCFWAYTFLLSFLSAQLTRLLAPGRGPGWLLLLLAVPLQGDLMDQIGADPIWALVALRHAVLPTTTPH